MIHSALSAGGAGGTADFAISGLPAGAVVSVADDAAREFQLSAIPGEAVGDWSWVSNRGDGGALNLGLDPTFITTVNPTSFTGITDWQWLSGSLASPDVINLGQTSPIVIANTHTPETQEDVAQIVQASGTVNIDVTGNDSHPDGFDLEVVSATGANNGTVSVNPDGTIDYTPDPGFAGDDVFQYTVSRFLPESCQDIQDFDPSLTDGEYEIYPNGGRFTVYCEGLDGTPAEYLPLVNTGSSFNYGQYTAGGASPGTNVRTNYTKLRLDPATLIVDIGDQLFSSSSGSISHSGGPTVVTSMPLGVAMACRFNNRTAGLANIDLLGTSFFVDDTFTLGGFEPDGVATFSAGDQVVDVTGGGFCGQNQPTGGMGSPYNERGRFSLDLGYNGGATPGALSATGQVTVTVLPIGVEDDAETFVDEPVTVDVLANDRDSDGTDLLITAVTDGANGTVAINPDGTIDYTPNAGFEGGDQFEYTVSAVGHQSCQDVRSADPSSNDGNYEISPNGNVFTIFCRDMDGANSGPHEYLNLARTGGARNRSRYNSGGGTTGTDVTTRYTKLSIDPISLVVDTGDQTYSTSSGSLQQGNIQVTSMPYAVAMSCVARNDESGSANLNLRGTPFFVDDSFVVAGFFAEGGSTFSADAKVVNLTGGGACAWNNPSPGINNPSNQNGGEILELGFSGSVSPNTTVLVSVTVIGGPTGINISSDSVDENSPADTVVGDLTAIDASANDSHTFELISNPDGLFAIGGVDNDQLLVATGAVLDFETTTSHDISIKVTDSTLLTFEQDFTINVNGLNEAPTDIILSNDSVDENSEVGVVVGELSGDDPDVGDALSFLLVSNPGGRFSVGGETGSQLIVFFNADLDFETEDQHDVTIRVFDQGVPPIDEETAEGYEEPLFYDEEFTINILDVDEAPTASIPVGDPAVVLIDGTVQLDGAGSDPETDSSQLAFSWDLNDDGDFETPGQSVDFAASIIEDPILAGGDPNDTLVNVTLQVCDPGGQCDTAQTTVELALAIVTNSDNSGPGSLRQAISDMHPMPGGTIRFAPGVTDDIELSGTSNLNIYRDLTIEGPGSSVLTVIGSAQTPVIQVAGGVIIQISGLTLIHGAPGATGGLNNAGIATLTDVSATGHGAYGINNLGIGTLTIEDSEINDNGAYWAATQGAFTALASGIINDGSLALNNVTLNDNAVQGILNRGSLEITDGSMSGNGTSDIHNTGSI